MRWLRTPLKLMALVVAAAGCQSSTTTNDGPAATPDLASRCRTMAERYSAACPATNPMFPLPTVELLADHCEDEYSSSATIGCEALYETYVTCAATASIECSDGSYPACSTQYARYDGCQSDFASATFCSPTWFGANPCADLAETPYVITCIREPPVECVPLTEPRFCCPDMSHYAMP